MCIEKQHPRLSVWRQCKLLSLTRSGLYYHPVGKSAENLKFVKIIDKQFLNTPWYGSCQMAGHMKRHGHKAGRHRVRRLMRLIQLVPIYQAPNTSRKHPHQQDQVRTMLQEGQSIRAIARHFNVGVATIDRIKRSTNLS